MQTDLKSSLSSTQNLPSVIGVYDFSELRYGEDDSLQISYSGNNFGYFTIVIYRSNEEVTPDDIEHPKIIESFEDSIASIFELERLGYYNQVELIKKEPLSFEDDEEPLFHSAFFSYQTTLENGEVDDTVFSFLFLRADAGYLHKIRFTESVDHLEEALDKMEYFLKSWMKFINSLNVEIN